MNDVILDVSNLQKKVENSYEAVRSSVQSVENAVSTLKRGVDKMSKCLEEFMAIESKNNQLQESVMEVNRDIKTSKGIITDIEKSLTAMVQHNDFRKPTKIAKHTHPTEACLTTTTSNIYTTLTENEHEEDEEITFRNTSGEQSTVVILDDQSSENEDRQAERESSQDTDIANSQKDGETEKESINENDNNSKNMSHTSDTAEIDTRKSSMRRNKVCLIGDSISGQVNQVELGKSTRTYVQKLRAPKIQDVSKVESHVRDASLIIVHTGINDIRQEESAENRVSDFVKVLRSLQEAAPESKIVVSKPIPIGDKKLDIERSIFNASIAKELSLNEDINACLLDHSNLAEQSLPIKQYYRQDLIHLSPSGVDVFSTNLRQKILEMQGKTVSPGNDNGSHRIDSEESFRNYGPRIHDSNRRDSSEERYMGPRNNGDRNGRQRNFLGRNNGNQHRDDNRDSNRYQITGHQASHYGNRDGQQRRGYERASNWRDRHHSYNTESSYTYSERNGNRVNNRVTDHRITNNGTRDGYPTKDDSRRNHEPHRGQHSHTGNRYRYNYRDNVRYPRDNYSSERYSEHESGYYDDSYYDMY